MKFRLMDLLACPICKTFPLTLHVFQDAACSRSRRQAKHPECELYCGFRAVMIGDLVVGELDCTQCFTKEVTEGILLCGGCRRWYPIIDEIPHMLPDELRNEKEDRAFLSRYLEKIPKEVMVEGLPIHL